MIKINSFWGDLTDVSAKKEALLLTYLFSGLEQPFLVVLPLLHCIVVATY